MTAPVRTLALACAITVAVAACGKQEMPAPPTPEVGVIQLQAQTVPLQRDMVGRLSAYRSADVRARVAGVLQKRLYTEGADVKAGQPLFQIDPAPLRAVLSQAQGELAAAQATYANAKITAERNRSLIQQQYVSQADLDNAEAAERSAAAAVQQAKAAVETARINLGYASVTAPISGRAGNQQVTEGALVGSGDVTLLTTVDQIDPLYVNFSMNNSELAQLKASQSKGALELSGNGQSTIEVKLGDGSIYPHNGTLDFSSATVDASTGSVTLRATLPNPEHTLMPGAFVNFQANLGQRNGAYLVPQTALLRDSVGPYLLVVGKDGKVIRRDVTTDGQLHDKWVVSAGLEAGDQIIVEGVQKAKEGSPAKAVPYQPATKPAAAAGQQPAAAPTEKK